ncbi:PIN domain-like protein [Suillus tomentosus]|nr:PIN domain-like protein [Suillus tomentosus]
MGISGLLPLLKSIQLHRHLSDFAGQTLAVDAYVWLHRGVYACATEIATGKPSTKYVDYAMQRVRLLRHHKIRPYIVFDGGPLPAKLGTETERKQRREENLAKAKALASQGRHKEAREYFVKCIDVTPQMAYQLIKALRAENVPYVVAPYEADAQMAYLERVGLVDGIITEDSDLLVFGCRKVLFKLDSISSTIVSISREDFGSVTATEGGISLLGWSDAQFRAMAILSGCDYLPSIPGIGLKTAWSLLRKYRSVGQVVQAIRLEGKKSVPKGYLEAYNLAENVFLYQRVYCPLDERLVNLTEIPTGVKWGDKEESYIGGSVSEQSLAGDLEH